MSSKVLKSAPFNSHAMSRVIRYGYIVAFWFCLMILLGVSLIPDIDFNERTFAFGIRQDYGLHFLGYAILSWACLKSYGLRSGVVLFLTAFAVGTELVQYLVEGRLVQLMDTVSNVLGVATTLLITWVAKLSRGVGS